MSGRSRSRSRSRNNSTYKTYKYEALQPLLNKAYNAATTRYRPVTNEMRPRIEEHMYNSLTYELIKKKSSHTNDTVKPAIKAFLNAKYANFNTHSNSSKIDPVKVYKNMVHTGLLKKEMRRETMNPRGGATRRHSRKRA